MTNPSWICPRPAHWPVRPDGHQQTTAAWRARFVYLTLLLNLVGTAHYIACALGPLLVVFPSYATKAAYWKLGALDGASCGAAIPTVRKTITHPTQSTHCSTCWCLSAARSPC